MTTDTIETQEQTSSQEDQAAEALAFESSFQGDAQPVAKEAVPAPQVPADAVDPVKEAAPTAPSPKADDFDARMELRKVNGRIGALNDQLHQALKSKEGEGKPPTLTTKELTRLKAEFPEMAALLENDIADVISGLSIKAPDSREFNDLVQRAVADAKMEIREEAVNDNHESWKTDLWVDGKLGETRTADYDAWRKTMTPEQAAAIESSNSPAFVNRKLTEFYGWKAKNAKAEAGKQDRLKSALTPQGNARGGPQTMSDQEAERKAFEDEFNN